ncbi:MAG: PRD domain-containing protein [Culicoidibacterales bacterium]
MRINKVINNNVVSSFIDGAESLIMGKGIGFDQKKGERLNEELIEKVYTLRSSEVGSKIATILEKESVKYFDVTEKIINFAQEKLGRKLDELLYVLLTDHLSFAAKRAEQNIIFQNPLIREIKILYKKEFSIGISALKIIYDELQWELPIEEAGFIALHIVNASNTPDMLTTLDTTQLVHDILHQTQQEFAIVFDEESLDYLRLMTHLNFFAQRVVRKQMVEEQPDELTSLVIKSYPRIAEFVQQVIRHVEIKYECLIPLKEHAYLILHYQRIL